MEEEKSLSEIESHFGAIFTDLKGSKVLFEDLLIKAEKLSKAIETVAIANHVFLDSFQKVADAATTGKGSTRDLGTVLIKMYIRQRSIELKSAEIARVLNKGFILPLNGSLKEWEKATRRLEQDYEKDSRKAAKTAKKAAQETYKQVKKTEKKEKKGKDASVSHDKMEAAMKTSAERHHHLEEVHQEWMRKLLVEQRTRYCHFIEKFSPVVETECSLLEEIQHVQSIASELNALAQNPTTLPKMSEEHVQDLRIADPVRNSPMMNRRSKAFNRTSSMSSNAGESDEKLSRPMSFLAAYEYSTSPPPPPPPNDDIPLPPPPPPVCEDIQQRPLPPPPPPPTLGSSGIKKKQRSPPVAAAGPLAPPPPPPPAMNGNVRHTPRERVPTSSSSRGALLSDIAKGRRLKPTVTNDKSAPKIR
ncbi:protein MTSS 1-like [Oscarella lobularis]|uniref:protein MTSS 1-like n=1 Tax=Oscarella lobularis TaxID=121494 RepID=UPI0033131E39